MTSRVDDGGLRNWAGNIRYAASSVARPASLGELQEIVAGAASVRAVGSGHSFNTIADTTGVLVSTRGLDGAVEVDADRRVAVVPGGATYAEVARELHAAGWALPNLGSLPHISVAGACSTGTHGSGLGNGCLATQVVGVELVLADGSLLTADTTHPDFGGLVLALGALGVVTRLWLALEPTFDVAQDVVLGVPADRAAAEVGDILAAGHSVSIFTAFAEPGTIDSVWRKRRVGAGPVTPVTDLPDWGGRPAGEPVHPLLGLDAAAATEQLGRPGPWHQRIPHFREEFTPSAGDELQSEFFVPLGHAGAVLHALTEAAPRFRDALQVFEMRSVAADDLWMSPFRERASVAVHATWISDLDRVRTACAALEEVLTPYDPRPHWAKVQFGFDAERLAAVHPGLERWRDLAGRLDPDGCFVNDYVTSLGLR